MEISSFAVWKFKNVEGCLRNCRGYDFNVTRFLPKKPTDTECFQLRYGLEKNMVTLEHYNLMFDLASELETAPFTDVVKLLKKYKLYDLIPNEERHSCARTEEKVI